MRGAMFWAAAAAAVAVASGQAPEAACSTGPSVAATVFAVLLLLTLAALGIVMYQYIWKPRHCPSLEKVVLAENGQQEGRFAFDNPYMTEDDDIGSKSTLPCNDILAINEKTGTSRSGDRTPKKHGFCMISPAPSQSRSHSEDSSHNEAEQVTVPLKGHDFTGLGFSINGGMREGIFVSSVSQHGPALESGLVEPGDRVMAVTVSFNQITLEDAKAILSQSSPYNVQLHLQKATTGGGSGGGSRKTSTPPAPADRHTLSTTDPTEQNGTSRASRHTNSAEDSSPNNKGSPTRPGEDDQLRRKTAADTSVSEKQPPSAAKETSHLVQRVAAATHKDSASSGFREMAVDVPEHMDDTNAKRDARPADGGAARVRQLGVQVLPSPAAAGAGELRDGRRSVALGVPSLRLAAREPADGHCVETCLTKLANDQPCGRDLDDETGEPSTPSAEDGDHRRVRMGTSSFKKQARLERKELDDGELIESKAGTSDKNADGDGSQAVTEAEINAEAKLTETGENGSAPGEGGDENPESQETLEDPSSEKEIDGEEGESEVDLKKPVIDHKDPDLEEKTQPDIDTKSNADHTATGNERKRSTSASSSSSTNSGSGSSSPVRERPKQMSFEIPDEMRLAAGAAQDRRSRADRPARSALPGSLEVLANRAETPTEEQTSSVATPEGGVSDSGEDVATEQESDDKLEGRPADSGEDASGPVQEEELKRTVRPDNVYQGDEEHLKVKMDKLEAFKEVLSLTPSTSQPAKRKSQTEEVDVVGETVERGHIDRCPCDGPTSAGTAPRITGEVTGLVDVGGKKSARAGPIIVGVTESRPRPAAAASSAAVGRARSVAAALPEALRPIRRRDSGGTAPEPAAWEASAPGGGGRLCSSTGDLTRSEPARADSPLGRTVSMQIAGGASVGGEPRVSAAACDMPELDLSRVGQQEGYAPLPSRRLVSAASSSESLDTEQLPEQVANEPDGPQPQANHTTNGAESAEHETTASSAAPTVLPPEKEHSSEAMVNGLSNDEDSCLTASSEASVEPSPAPVVVPRVLTAEIKPNADNDRSDGLEGLGPTTSAAAPSTAAEEAAEVSTTSIPLPVVVETSPEPVAGSPDPSRGGDLADTPPDASPVEAGTDAPVARSRRGPPPTPPPRSAATRQPAPPPPPPPPSRSLELFEISSQELDSVMISHEEFLRQEAERRAHVCRLAATAPTSRESSPAHEPR